MWNLVIFTPLTVKTFRLPRNPSSAGSAISLGSGGSVSSSGYQTGSGSSYLSSESANSSSSLLASSASADNGGTALAVSGSQDDAGLVMPKVELAEHTQSQEVDGEKRGNKETYAVKLYKRHFNFL